MKKSMMMAGVGVFGVLVLASACASLSENNDGREDEDQQISMAELPAAVKPLAEKETTGCKIIEVEQERKDGKVIYAITYDQAGTLMELEYLPDGTLLYKGKE